MWNRLFKWPTTNWLKPIPQCNRILPKVPRFNAPGFHNLCPRSLAFSLLGLLSPVRNLGATVWMSSVWMKTMSACMFWMSPDMAWALPFCPHRFSAGFRPCPNTPVSFHEAQNPRTVSPSPHLRPWPVFLTTGTRLSRREESSSRSSTECLICVTEASAM